MKVTYKTNAAYTSESMTKWFFGSKFVETLTASAKRMNKKTGETTFRFWQEGTGYQRLQTMSLFLYSNLRNLFYLTDLPRSR